MLNLYVGVIPMHGLSAVIVYLKCDSLPRCVEGLHKLAAVKFQVMMGWGMVVWNENGEI